MKDINKTIKHFESLQKRYTTQHNGQMCERVEDALEALHYYKDQLECSTTLLETKQAQAFATSRITTIGEEFFTPEQVRKMSQSEVKKNYKKILESMKYWH
jgi:hypothetical protein